jgi:hypothetical protein
LSQIIAKCSVISRVNNLFTIYYFDILARKVIVSRDEFCASNDEDGMVRVKPSFPAVGHGSHAAAAGTKERLANGKPTGAEKSCQIRGAGFAAKGLLGSPTKGLLGPLERTCDKASPAAAVMLHLRSCYVSKAAILTSPVLSVPAVNRSPA